MLKFNRSVWVGQTNLFLHLFLEGIFHKNILMFAQGLVTPVIKNLESKNLAEAGSNWEGWICCMGRNGVEWCIDTLDFNMYTILHTLLIITNYIALHNIKLHTYNIQYYTIIYICRLHVDR